MIMETPQMVILQEPLDLSRAKPSVQNQPSDWELNLWIGPHRVIAHDPFTFIVFLNDPS